jgi:hypothetical protein
MFAVFRVAPILVLAAGSMLAQSSEPRDDTPEPAAPESSTDLAANPPADLNVNSRYTIESINFVDHREYKLSNSSLDAIRRLVGAKVSSEALERLTQTIREELRAHDVTFKLTRGEQPDSVRVLIQVDHAGGSIDASIPVLNYNSQTGFSGAGQLTSTLGPNVFTFRAVRDTDSFIERASGIQAKYERIGLAGGRIRIGFEFDGYADQYNSSTLTALDGASRPSSLGAGAYGSRLNYEPSATFVIAEPLTYTIGLSFEQLNSLPSAPARSESANAVTNTLRFHEHWSDSREGVQRQVDAAYSLRAATTILGTDLAYTRHVGHLKYNYSSRRQSVEVNMIAGAIYGEAPLFERFAIGDGTLLRGWNKYDLDPIGGNRLMYGSVTYGYRMLRIFYDTGAVWDQGKPIEVKQSAGIGVSSGLGVLQKGAFLVALAFPFRQGGVIPVLIAGMNF